MDPTGMPAPEDAETDPAQLLEGAERLESMREDIQVARDQIEQLRFSNVGHQELDEALGLFAETMAGELAQIAETMRSTVEELRMAGEAYAEIELMTGDEPVEDS
ncbi:MAG: hypothetical protein ACRDV9_06760 [Acidimicrobiia bacterium]